MTLHLTGHAEIDQQHELLDSLAEQLADFCPQGVRQSEAGCAGCTAIQLKHCRAALASLTKDFVAALAGHTEYEEKMMQLLPDAASCQEHIRAHKAAHLGITRQMDKLAIRIRHDNPRDVSRRLFHVVGNWLYDHSIAFDTRLVSLGETGERPINLDDELTSMLDQHVFINRPTRTRTSSRGESALQKKQHALSARFQSLTPAQCKVFWLVVSGQTNREISASLGVTVNTIKTHRTAIFQKMNVKSVLELAKLADSLRLAGG